MAKQPRKKSEFGFYHVILRSINHSVLFEEDMDYLCFLKFLKRYSLESKCKIFAYVLMLNHVHILLRDEEENLSSFIKNLAGKYAVFFNKKYGRVGNLFQGRFQSEAVEDNTYLLTLLRYIHQNPIKAAVVRGLSAYRWSSFGEYTDRAMIIDKNFIMEMFGNDIEQFAGFHNDTISRITSRADLANNRLSDERIIAALKEKFKIHAATASALPREKALELVKIFSAQGASQRQLGRIFGLPKTTIQRWTR